MNLEWVMCVMLLAVDLRDYFPKLLYRNNDNFVLNGYKFVKYLLKRDYRVLFMLQLQNLNGLK